MPYLRAQRILQLSRNVHVFHMQSMYIARQAIHLVIILNDLVDVHEGPDDEQYQERIDLEDELIELFYAMQEWGANPDKGLQVDYDQGLLKINQQYAQFFRERFYFYTARNLPDDFIYGKLIAYDRKTIDFRKWQHVRTAESSGVNLNGSTAQDKGDARHGSMSLNSSNAGLSFPPTKKSYEWEPMLTPEAVDQVYQLPPTNLGWHNFFAPNYSNTLLQGLPGPSHRLSTFSNPLILSAPSSQQQRQLLPSRLPDKVITPNTSYPLEHSSFSLLLEPQPLPRVATNSKPRHPLLDNNFRELSQAKERDLLIQVLHSHWLAANELEPHSMGRSILMGFLHRSSQQAPLRCSFDSCMRSFDRQDRAVAHVRLHLNFKPYACDGACGKRRCKARFFSPHCRRSHTLKTKVTCSNCGGKFYPQNLHRHVAKCGKR